MRGETLESMTQAGRLTEKAAAAGMLTLQACVLVSDGHCWLTGALWGHSGRCAAPASHLEGDAQEVGAHVVCAH
jgi:hypothetical protein